MPEKFDRCVQHVMDQGHSEASAHAICTVSVGRGLLDDSGQIRGGITEELMMASQQIPQKREDGSFVCPGCGGACPSMACPHCGAACPCSYCPMCAFPMYVGACIACGQPMPAQAAHETAEHGITAMNAPTTVVALVAGPGGTPARVISCEQVRSLGAIEATREEEFSGIVEAYASAETLDRHGTVVDQDAVLPLLATARVDQQHDKMAIDGITVESVARVKRQLGDKETDSVKTVLRFDLAIDAAKAAFEKIRSGVYKGLSIMFRMPDQLAEAVQAGTTNLISQIEDLPFVSLVTSPSCEEAVIDCYRAAPELPVARDLWAEAKRKLEEVMAESTARSVDAVREAETKQAGELDARLIELRAYVDSRFNELQAKVLELMNSQVVGALGAVRTHADTAVRDLEVRLAREVRSQVASLRVVKPKREIDMGGDQDQPTKPPAVPYSPLRFNF